MLSPIPEELHSAFPPKTEEEVENDWLTERANNIVHERKIEHQKYVQLAIQEWQDAGEHRGYLEDYMVTANVGKQLVEEAEAEYSRLVNRGARLMQKRLHPSWAVEDSAEPSVQQPAEGVAGPGHEERSPEPRASQSTVTNSSARGASVSRDSLYDATQPEYHPSSDGGVSEEDEPAPPMAPASPAIELLDSPTPEPGRPPLQVDPRLRRGWDPNYENFDDWFSIWPEPESLYGEDYGDLHYAMCKWLRDWEFDKFDIEYQPPPLRVETPELRRFALVWMPWFMVTGLGLTPFEGPVRRGKMSFLRCLIDGVPWDVFPPGVGMSWWSAEQISRSLDLARTKFTASQGPWRWAYVVPKRDNPHARQMLQNAPPNNVTWNNITWSRAVDAVVMVECDGVDGISRHTGHNIRLFRDLQRLPPRAGRWTPAQLMQARILRCATCLGNADPRPNHPAGHVPHFDGAVVEHHWTARLASSATTPITNASST
eukprot:jgi/Tetstr1/465545/TSEL_010214.t1